jgi:enoyl-CoA hydratase
MIKSTEHIEVSYERDVVVLTLNRPETLNAIAPDTSDQLRSVLLQLDDDEDSRVAVLTGAGRGFCSGGDVKSMPTRHRPGVAPKRVYSQGRHLIHAFMSVEKPIIAMVNGPAAGLGATLALFCDMVVMADEASIGDRHVNVGLVAGDGGAVMWPLLVGPLRAKELMITGRMLSGQEAAQMGLVNRSVPLERLREETFQLAHEIAALPPYAVRATKTSVNRFIAWMTNLVLEPSLAWEKISMMSHDHQEALAARREKRAGVYTGQ